MTVTFKITEDWSIPWEPYEDSGCMKLVQKLYAHMGLEITGDYRKDQHQFVRVEKPRFADVAVFEELRFTEYHVAFMLDHRRAIQCSAATNGVAKIEITRDGWAQALRGFYRHKSRVEFEPIIFKGSDTQIIATGLRIRDG